MLTEYGGGNGRHVCIVQTILKNNKAFELLQLLHFSDLPHKKSSKNTVTCDFYSSANSATTLHLPC